MGPRPSRTDESVAREILTIVQSAARQRGITRSPGLEEPLDQRGLGLDSLAMLSLLVEVEEELGVELPEDCWGERTPQTVGEIARLVEQIRRGKL